MTTVVTIVTVVDSSWLYSVKPSASCDLLSLLTQLYLEFCVSSLFWLSRPHEMDFFPSFLARFHTITLFTTLTKEAHNKILFGMDFSVFGMDFCRFRTCFFCYCHGCRPRTQVSLKGVNSIMWFSFSRCFLFNVSYEGVIRQGASMILCSETTRYRKKIHSIQLHLT